LALVVTPASADERTQVDALAAQIQAVTGDHVELAWVDQGYTGEEVAQTAAAHGIQLEVVKLPEAVGPKRGFVLVPRRWVVERGFAWMARFRRLARDYERLPSVLAGLHFIAFACLLLHRITPLIFNP
jgi:transposase